MIGKEEILLEVTNFLVTFFEIMEEIHWFSNVIEKLAKFLLETFRVRGPSCPGNRFLL